MHIEIFLKELVFNEGLKLMFILYCDSHKKAIFWSAKCACSSIKYAVYNIIEKRNLNRLHIKESYGNFNKNKLDEYEKILICRNPYSRVVSSYIEKINEFKEYNNFNNFIYNFDMYKNHHTTPQFSEVYSDIVKYNYELIFNYVYSLDNFNLKTFLKQIFSYEVTEKDLKNIPYNANSYQQSIPRADLLDNKALQTMKDKQELPKWLDFYQDINIIKQVEKLYKIDFENLSRLNLNYKI